MKALYLITVAAVVFSFVMDRHKSVHALLIGLRRFVHILLDLLLMTALVGVILSLVKEQTIAHYLAGSNLWLSSALAGLLGSVTLMPGFIAYPLCGLLRQQGVPYLVLGIFSTTLMMVGVVTFPLERRYFGTKVAVQRNLISLLIALSVGLAIGIAYGEIAL